MKSLISNKKINSFRYIRLLVLMLSLTIMGSSIALSIPKLDLRSNENFVILAGSTVTGIPPVSITGNVGLSPAAGSLIVGFDGSNVDGILYVVDATGPAGSVQDATLLQTAKSDLTTAYNDAAGRTPVPTGSFLNPGDGNIGGLNLVAGLYKFTSSAAITGADVTLTGSSSDVWIFQIATSLNVGSGIKVILAGGAQASNIFWQVGTSATIGTYSTFKGTILADQSISFGTDAAIDGRALAFTGAVTMSSGVTTNRADTVAITDPIFTVNPSELQFGNVAVNTQKMDSVEVENTGNADLIISNVTSSNNMYSVTPNGVTLTPGATKMFYVTFLPTSNGDKNGYIYFTHNAENIIDSILVNGMGVSSGFTVNPSELQFGDVTVNTQKTESVEIKNTGNADLIISNITSSNNMYSVSPNDVTITPGATKMLNITFLPTSNGDKSGYIYFTHSAENIKDSIFVNGTGVSAGFTVNPTSLNFVDVKIGTTKTDSVMVTNNGTSNLVISSLSSSNALFTATPKKGTILPGASKKFYVTFVPTSSGTFTGFIYFNHNGSSLKDSISVMGTSLEVDSKISINPTILDFGTIIIGNASTKTVLVRNIGTIDLEISSIQISDPRFSIDPLSGIIAPGTYQNFNVTFKPTYADDYFSTIEFTYNGGNDIITAMGVGIDVVTINDARKLPQGTEFAAEGVVTRTMGQYTRIQDETGALTIFQASGQFYNDVANSEIAMADKIQIQGVISELDYLKVINGSDLNDFKRLSRNNPLPTPLVVTLDNISNSGENYESKLISVSGLKITDVGDLNFKESKTYNISDESYNSNNIGLNIDLIENTEMAGMPFIGENVTFVGVLSQSSQYSPIMGYQLTPVLETDLFSVPSSVLDNDIESVFSLSDNHPNPFISTTTINFYLVNSEFVKLSVTDFLSNEVATLVNGFTGSGYHSVLFDANKSNLNLSGGLYFLRMDVSNKTAIKPIILMK